MTTTTELKRQYYTFDEDRIRMILDKHLVSVYFREVSTYTPNREGLSPIHVEESNGITTLMCQSLPVNLDKNKHIDADHKIRTTDRDGTVTLLLALGYNKYQYSQEICEAFSFGGCGVVFNHHPGLPMYITIEAPCSM